MRLGKNKLNSFFKKPWLGALIVFSSSLFFSRWFWPEFVFADPDTWYHVFLTERLSEGIPREFPWLPFTALGEVFMDHHLLYHAALYPFVKLFGAFAGAKIATQIFFAGGIAVFFSFARSLGLRWPIFWTVLLAVSPSFLFRMHLAKAPSFAALWILLGLWAAARGRWLILGLLSFFFVWAYGAWPLLPFSLLILFLGGRGVAEFLSPCGRGLRRGVVASILGSILGLLVNPYFPENLRFTWVHNIKIGILGAPQYVGVGAEWYPPSFFEVFGYHSALFLIFAAVLALFIFHARQSQNSEIGANDRKLFGRGLAWFILTAVFFVLTLRSRRHIEYFTPFAVIAMAHLFTLSFSSLRPAVSRLWRIISDWRSSLLTTGAAILIVGVIVLQTNSLFRHRAEFNDERPPHYLAGQISWLKTYGRDGAFVFHTDWDDFPFFLYGAPRLRYTIGLDPLLLAGHAREKYDKWREIVRGEFAGDAVQEIKRVFGASYIILNSDYVQFSRQVELNSGARLRYKEEKISIYEILEES